MPIEFYAEATPSERLCKEVANLVPTNPFYTFEYLESKRVAGFRPWMLLMRENGQLVSGCPAFFQAGFLNRSLEIESLPAIPDSAVFWEQLQRFCRQTGISRLGVHTAASTSARIPALPGEIWRRDRWEYVLELHTSDLWKRLRNSHRWRINQSRKAGVTVARTSGPHAWKEHASAVRASLERRKNRGEIVAMVRQTKLFGALIDHGCGELFQAILNGKVLSSALVARGQRGAYYLWAGTTAEGMTLGVSHFLVFEIARIMQEDSLDLFNLGGAHSHEEGLIQFKRGFGTTEVSLEAADFCLGSRVKRTFGRAFEVLRDDPSSLLKRAMDLVRSN